MKKIIMNIAKKNHWLLTILREIRFLKNRIYYLYYYFKNEIDENLIIFESYMGRQYSCSPKAIYEKLLENNQNYTYIWAFKDLEKFKDLENNKNTKIVKFGSKEYYKYYTKAKYWITNSRLNERIKKKKNQVYIQCWHGTPLKKLGFDIQVTGGNAMNSKKDIQKKYKSDSKRYTYMISPSRFCTEKFTSAFHLKDKTIVKEVGYPRNDYLYNYKKEDIVLIKNKLQIPQNKKVILYAPTWRDNQHESGVGYTYKLGIDFEKLKEQLSDQYILLFRTHYFVANSINLEQYKDFIINVSEYEDINELYIISDLLITDYSSVFFDYANLKRPMLFYMYDYDEYKNKLRDFYIDLKELPGPIVKEEEQLIQVIKDYKNISIKYKNQYNKFNKKYNYLDDGHSSERLIKECIK